MKLKLLLLTGLFGFIIGNNCISQVIVDSKAVVSNVDFNLINEELVITYDIENSRPGELFLVKVNILTETGKAISAKSLKGDVGGNVSGGLQKKIIWEISKDIAFLDDKISVEVEAVNQNPKLIHPVSKGIALLLSTVYPGLGSSKITLKGYHLIKGVAAYGSLAGSFLYQQKSDRSALDYDAAVTAADRDKYFAANHDQKQLSKILMYTAGAIWLIDYITVLASENRSQKKGFKSKIVYLGPAIGSQSYVAGMTMICNF
ncbi:MAG: hypothetical protein WCS03_03065 [Bacteroidota bacterium]